jgi:hypothetical protein
MDVQLIPGYQPLGQMLFEVAGSFLEDDLD